jgi:hypothetical protein
MPKGLTGFSGKAVPSPTSKPDRNRRWGLILVALATGFSIVALAFFSKRVLAEPMRPVFFAIPPLLMSAYEYLAHRQQGRLLSSSAFWVATILVVTTLIFLSHWI